MPEENICETDNAVQLEITRVDLSIAEEENEQAAPLISQSAVPEPLIPPPQSRMPAPPPLVIPPEQDSVAVRTFENVLRTNLRPDDIKVPESLHNPETGCGHEQSAATAAAPIHARVDAPPAPRRSIRPKYPDGARKRGEQGNVTLELEVNVQGIVVDVKVAAGCGFAELEQAAVAAARKALFLPAKRDGKPVASRARLTLTFRLKD